jgi:hypothetical protein
MPRARKPTGISCTSSDCGAGLHCFKATAKMASENRSGICRECGANLIDWKRVQNCNIQDVRYTFEALKLELVRHHFWHIKINQRAINHARRKGKRGLRATVRRRLENTVGPAHPFHDGFQTTMDENSTTAIPFGQHATATCCRKCIEYWHSVPVGQSLTGEQLQYFTELVYLYIEDRIPSLTEHGEVIPKICRQKVTHAG